MELMPAPQLSRRYSPLGHLEHRKDFQKALPEKKH